MRHRTPRLHAWPAVAAATLAASPAAAQVTAAGDPFASDPVGIVADPCPPHPKVGWNEQQLHNYTRDFGQLCRYRAENAALKQPVRVVFLGDSITDNWIGADPGFFTNGIVDRGIGGQTTPQLLVRFRQDVLALKPKLVHIMIGTNDIAGNTGAATIETVEGHIATMAELARAHGIRVILASVPPAAAFPWAKDKQPVPQIAALNRWIAAYAKAQGFTYVDYHPVLATPEGGMRPGLATDGVHPTPAGYAAMRPVAEAAIARAMAR
ncbi:hypothetical protein GCM10011380_19300 [Sphingomonas metalli]|uniref:SGNH hydrolase-type esterase domain-containing protein n=1 Tax=Sphingomonas metalli TaxID=1779358 RepID=A0A916T3B3_9SPHN|nr:SGNH/GDSL hydrolase family protein [Sphingomonas metalli]GGB29935.1 hypothetical protein GCM10011380_19300 [Sphingomonas metalli]